MGPFFPVKEFLSQIIYDINHIRPAGDKYFYFVILQKLKQFFVRKKKKCYLPA